MIGGAALTAYGLSRFRKGGWILAGFGVLLFRRGAIGHCFTYDLLGLGTALSDMVDRGSHLAERGPREPPAASGEPQP